MPPASTLLDVGDFYPLSAPPAKGLAVINFLGYHNSLNIGPLGATPVTCPDLSSISGSMFKMSMLPDTLEKLCTWRTNNHVVA